MHDISGPYLQKYSFWYTLFYFANCPPRQGRFLTQFFPLENLSTFQLLPYPFVYKWLTAERLGVQTIHCWRVGVRRGFIHRLYFTCLSALCIRFFKGHFYFPTIAGKVHHSCGEGTPQLWAITIKGIKTTFLLKRTTFKEEKRELFWAVSVGNGLRGSITL